MKWAWAAKLDAALAPAAAALRMRPGIEVCESGGAVWLRGREADEALELELRRLPGAERFEVVEGGRVRAVGKRVPCGRLPEAGWGPVAAWAVPGPQPAARAAALTQRVNVRIVRAAEEAPANLLRLPMEVFAAWAEGASTARLRPLAFAVSGSGEALVRGVPPPSLPGRRYAEREGIALPCGWTWEPAVPPAVLRARVELAAGDLALFEEDGGWEKVPAAAFVRATRSAVRGSVANE